MENFFNWMSKPVPSHEVEVWFQVHNMVSEKIDLYGDIFLSLSKVIKDTYLGDSNQETKIIMTDEDLQNHFDWCWKTTLKNFELENISIGTKGEHKEYLRNFFYDTFYHQDKVHMRDAIPEFLEDLFDQDKPFAKSDLDILTEIYKLLDKNVVHVRTLDGR